ncbi:hypothetical protein AXG93_374s1100 [Marchantia polymorpha subsp. ruderalis]|uniref:Uncharacterized protein n=1 Tax=Marchantia polymorpha subsp. ruderalis TaxID=1480154 RepID=A0A176WJE8_MARPO|nr:hypothetical protein AXG93_374s1100 [Marchantia polymorpha subsp. ruderalis]
MREVTDEVNRRVSGYDSRSRENSIPQRRGLLPRDGLVTVVVSESCRGPALDIGSVRQERPSPWACPRVGPTEELADSSLRKKEKEQEPEQGTTDLRHEWTGIAGPLRERKSGARGDDRAGEGEWEWGAGLGFTAACFFLGGFRCWSGCVRAQKHKDSEVQINTSSSRCRAISRAPQHLSSFYLTLRRSSIERFRGPNLELDSTGLSWTSTRCPRRTIRKAVHYENPLQFGELFIGASNSVVVQVQPDGFGMADKAYAMRPQTRNSGQSKIATPAEKIAYEATQALGRGFDVTTDFRVGSCKGSCLVELDEENLQDLITPTGVVIQNVSREIKLDKGERTRYKSDVVSFQQVIFQLLAYACPSI